MTDNKPQDSSSDSDDQFELESSDEEQDVVQEAKKAAASEDEQKSKPSTASKKDEEEAKKAKSKTLANEAKAKVDDQKKAADEAPKAKSKAKTTTKKASTEAQDEPKTKSTAAKKPATEAEETKAKKTKSVAKKADEAEPAKTKSKAVAKKTDDQEQPKAKVKAPAAKKAAEPKSAAKAKSKAVVAAKIKESVEYESVGEEDSSSSDESEEESFSDLINDESEEEAPAPVKTKPTPKKAAPKAQEPKKAAKAPEPKKAKSKPKVKKVEEPEDAPMSIDDGLSALTRSPSAGKKRRIEPETDDASVDSNASTSSTTSGVDDLFEPSEITGTFLNIDDSVELWRMALVRDVLNNEDSKKAFIASFEGVDFISNFCIRDYGSVEDLKKHIAYLQAQYFLHKPVAKDDAHKELLRLRLACELCDILKSLGIEIKGFASENREKVSKKTPSTYAHPLPKGYRRNDDEESVKGKEAKIVYIGVPSHLPNGSKRTVPSVPVHFKDEFKVYYPEDTEARIRCSANIRYYEKVQSAHPDLLVPLERMVALSGRSALHGAKKRKQQ